MLVMDNKIEIYKTKDNKVEVNVSVDSDTVQLNREHISILLDRDIKAIGKHINNIFKEKELDKMWYVQNLHTPLNTVR